MSDLNYDAELRRIALETAAGQSPSGAQTLLLARQFYDFLRGAEPAHGAYPSTAGQTYGAEKATTRAGSGAGAGGGAGVGAVFVKPAGLPRDTVVEVLIIPDGIPMRSERVPATLVNFIAPQFRVSTLAEIVQASTIKLLGGISFGGGGGGGS